ncbi:MAG TPA: gephyrin-like molybdotransferase Glp [Alphaproteobacteria bacterium]|nr:gephyrin-like molybdotransferase Glp [Alphaproteobacteria bacterium]
MLSVEEARARIVAAFETLAAEDVALERALHRVLATDIAARRTQPPSPVSAMDGYAVKVQDIANVPATLKVVGEAPAGGAYGAALKAGEAVRILTGGPVPDGADTVVIQEDTDRDGATLTVKETTKPGANVRAKGLDFKEGDVLLKKGKRLTARDIGLAAAMNRPWLPVTRKPRVAILATGDEIVRPGDPVGPNQIVSSNAPALKGLVESLGGEAIDLGIARDNEDSIATLARGAKGADLLLTTGGVSVGDRDLVAKVLGNQGLEIDFWKIAMKPGKPLMFGRLDGVPMMGLPGNPVSALVCSVLFLRPAIGKMLGLAGDSARESRARLGKELGSNNFREDYIRARLVRNGDGEPTAEPFGVQDSSMMTTFAAADCLIRRPPDAPAAKKGEWVPVLELSALGA